MREGVDRTISGTCLPSRGRSYRKTLNKLLILIVIAMLLAYVS